MALLRTWPVVLLPITLLCACAGTPLPTRSAVASPDIGWIDRQFRICGGNDCPAPTRKTLALVDSLPPRQEASPAPPEAPQVAVPPTNETEPPSVIIPFPFAGSRPTAEGRQRLHRLTQIARQYRRIELAGRTDDVGGKAPNDRLARQRAEYVRSWLLGRGVESEITVRAEGRCCYLDAAPTEAARTRNRRVEVRLAGRRDAIPDHLGAH
jgi:outer membrane protein OmpA-like peptidoglycan-associated protein